MWPPVSQHKDVGTYMDALNSTLGFHRVYATYDGMSDGLGRTHRTSGHKENLEAIARLLDIDVRFIELFPKSLAPILTRQRSFPDNGSRIAELDAHCRIYADMVANNVQSALILGSQVDVEVDLKVRLANAMGNAMAQRYDILFLGQTHSDYSEPGA
ncbi:hypothetical protein GGI20_004286, partial [Coemansia sp. BCRC 34301]